MSVDDGLRAIFLQNLKQIHWQAIESGLTGRGVPDANYCWRGAEGWVEFKWTPAYAVNVRPEQVGWILRRVRAGGQCWIAVRRRKVGARESRDELWMVRGSGARVLRMGGLLDALGAGHVAGTWTGGPRMWDWDEVAALLGEGACHALPRSASR